VRFLADESVDRQIVVSLRGAGYSVDYVVEDSPGISDPEVLERARSAGSVLIRLSGMPQSRKAQIAERAFRDHRHGNQDTAIMGTGTA